MQDTRHIRRVLLARDASEEEAVLFYGTLNCGNVSYYIREVHTSKY